MLTLGSARANSGGRSVGVVRIDQDYAFPPGVNITVVDRTNYFVHNGAQLVPVTGVKWVVTEGALSSGVSVLTDDSFNLLFTVLTPPSTAIGGNGGVALPSSALGMVIP